MYVQEELGHLIPQSVAKQMVMEADCDSNSTIEFDEFLAVETDGKRFHRFGHEKKLKISPKYRLADAAHAVLYGLHHGVFMGTDQLTTGRKTVLLAWLLLLHRLFPGAQNRASLRRLWFAVKNRPELSCLSNWRNYLSTWQLGDFPRFLGQEFESKVRYDDHNQGGCQIFTTTSMNGIANNADISSPTQSLMTCQLWTCFHVLAASCLHVKTVSPKQVMQGIHIYVKYFFGCRYVMICAVTFADS